MTSLPNALKHGAKPLCLAPSKKLKTVKSVRFTASSFDQESSNTAGLFATFLNDPKFPDFCIQHNFCERLQQCRLRRAQNKHIGFLEKTGPCKHLISFAPPQAISKVAKPTTLKTLLSQTERPDGVRNYPQYEVLKLARQLAATVLQFHATPLLREKWRSEDILLLEESSELIASTSLERPHLSVQLVRPKQRVCQASGTGTAMPSFIRNSYLFGLGVTLLELAYQMPLTQLRTKDDLASGQETNHTDMSAAERLSRTMGPSLGVGYAKFVRQCLACDFGVGEHDLKNPKLQEAVYRDVVCELERLERGFAKLQLAC